MGKIAKSLKAQAPSGGVAATLIIIIGAFILLYLLFLPEEERDKLIGKNESKDKVVSPKDIKGATLILENPGTFTPFEDEEFEHRIPSFDLFTKKEDEVLKSLDSIYVEATKGDSKTKSFSLTVTEPVENAKLSFTVSDHKGKLTIKQNDQEVFTGEVKNFIEPVSLELDEENVFLFAAETVSWWQFFGKKFYDLRDIKITATVQKIQNKDSFQSFFIGKEEFNLIEEASLSYFVDCKPRETGSVTILINGALLASKVPDCGNAERWQIDPEDLREGKNELHFISESGTVFYDKLILRTRLKEPIFPVYFFSVNTTVFRRIETNRVNATLTIKFIDDKERKVADVEVNEQNKFRLDTNQAVFTRNLDPFLKAGTNFLRIVPKTTLQIIELRLELDCKKEEECR